MRREGFGMHRNKSTTNLPLPPRSNETWIHSNSWVFASRKAADIDRLVRDTVANSNGLGPPRVALLWPSPSQEAAAFLAGAAHRFPAPEGSLEVRRCDWSVLVFGGDRSSSPALVLIQEAVCSSRPAKGGLSRRNRGHRETDGGCPPEGIYF